MAQLTIPAGVRLLVLDVMETLIPVSRKKMAGEVAKYSQVPAYAAMIGIIQTTSNDEVSGVAKVKKKLTLMLKLLWYLLLHLPQAGIVWRTYRAGKVYSKLMSGAITEEAFYAELQSALKLSCTQEEFFEVLKESLPAPEQSLLDLIEEAQSNGLKVALLTNIDPVLLKHFEQTYPWWQQVDAVIALCHFGTLKPSPSLLAEIESRCGIRGAEVFFIDNSPENVEMAEGEFGWKTHHWDPA